jgi:hypothetical protein
MRDRENTVEKNTMKNTTAWFKVRKTIDAAGPTPALRPVCALLLAAGMVALAGCASGNSSSKLQIGAIAFTDANGSPQTTLTSLTAGQSTYLSATLTGDAQLLGVDWSVYCGSAPPPGTPLPPGQTEDDSCGTFTPVHTMSGPVPSYVTSGSGYVTLYTAPATPPKQGTITLYAAATSNHSRVSTTALTVDALSIFLSFAPAPPSTLAAGAQVQMRAVVHNDPENGGVHWSALCGASDCGSFHPAQTGSGVAATYTAPAAIPSDGTVKITATSATDPTKSISSTVRITASL